MRRVGFIVALMLGFVGSAAAQGVGPGVTVHGPVTPGNCTKFLGATSIQDAGGPCGGAGNPAGADTQVQFNASSLFGADSTFTFNSSTKVIGGSAFNTTTPSGFQQNGATILTGGNIGSVGFPTLFSGYQAGQNINLGTANYDTGYGAFALQHDTASNGENAAFGALSCYLLTTGLFDTCFGIHSAGSLQTASTVTVFGNDAARNGVNIGGFTGIGKDAGRNGGAGGGATNSFGGGFGALFGNGASITVGGSATTGDVITLTFTASGSSPYTLPGSPVNVTYTVLNTDTLATITTGLITAINGNANLSAATPVGVKVPTVDPLSTTAFGLDFAGNSISGLTLVVTSSVSGSATETITIGGGNTGVDIVALGNQACHFLEATTAAGDICIGKYALASATSAADDVMIGWETGPLITSGSEDTFVGNNIAPLATLTYQTSIFGSLAGAAITGSSGGDSLFGYKAGYAKTAARGDSIFGTDAGVAITTGGSYAIFGASACAALTTNGFAACFGYNAGLSVTGAQGTYVGALAEGNAAGSAAGTVAVGYKAGYNVTGSTSTFIGANVAATTLTTGSNNLFIAGGETVDAVSASASNVLNIANVITGAHAAAPHPTVCVLGAPCIIGVARGINFDITTDQGIQIFPLNTAATTYMSTATKYLITAAWVANCSASMATAAGGIYPAISKGGTPIVANTQTYANCTSATTMQQLSLAAIAGTTVYTAQNIYFSLTTGNGGSGETGDVYVEGIPFN